MNRRTSRRPAFGAFGRRLRALTLTGAVTAALVGCAGASDTMKVETTETTAASVARHRTYTKENAQLAPEGFEASPLSIEARGKIQGMIDDQLIKRGYVPSDDGELVVRVSTGRRTVYKQPAGRAAVVGAPAEPESQGQLVIDIFERASNEKVFHGFATDEVETGKLDDAKLAEAVSRILADIPLAATGTPSM